MFYFVLSILSTVTAAGNIRTTKNSKTKTFIESDQLRNIVTATIATLGLESFNADTNSNYELVTMVPVDCATSDLDEPNCIGKRSFFRECLNFENKQIKKKTQK